MCFKKRKETENRFAVLEEKIRLLDVWREQKNTEVRYLKEELWETKRALEFLWSVRGEKEPVAVRAGVGNGTLSVGVKMYDPMTMRVKTKTALFGLDGEMKHWEAVRLSEDVIQVNVTEENGKRRAFAVKWKDLQVEEVTKPEEEEIKKRCS